MRRVHEDTRRWAPILAGDAALSAVKQQLDPKVRRSEVAEDLLGAREGDRSRRRAQVPGPQKNSDQGSIKDDSEEAIMLRRLKNFEETKN